jgi:hypothetical protein
MLIDRNHVGIRDERFGPFVARRQVAAENQG